MSNRFLPTFWIGLLLGVAVFEVGLLTNPFSGKEVVITQGAREWFLLIEVTPENSIVLRQEKEHDKYIVDESETHDRPMTTGEVDAAIADYVNSVKARATKK